jgi:taurine dioxygenase
MGQLRIRPLTPTVGAEISGLDLRKALSHEEVDAVEEALLVHGVVFFRDQDIAPEQQLAFARQMGPVTAQPFADGDGRDGELSVIEQTSTRGDRVDEWHADDTFMAEPPMGSILRAVELPTYGGDTCFASMHAAYDALSMPMKRMLEGLEAVHDIAPTLERAAAAGRLGADLAKLRAEWPPVVHPVVRTHPITGRKALFVNERSTVRLVGLPPRENDALLRLLLDHVRDPLFQCRFRWEVHSIAFWDNRSVQHYAVFDFAERRVLHRVNLAGDRPR